MLFVSGVAALLCACGGAAGGAEGQPAGRPVSGAELDAWDGRAAAAEEPAPAPQPAIEFAGGGRLEAFVALVRFEGGGEPVCAVYVLRARGRDLEEGRRSIPCPAGGLAGLGLDGVRLRPVEDARLAQLASALDGARPDPAPAEAGPRAVERVEVRVVTDRATVEGPAAPAAWPSPVDTEPEPAYRRGPENLTELYEAVMYPHRYER